MQDPVKQNLRTVNYTGIAGVLLLLVGTLALGVYPQYRDGQNLILATDKTAAARERVESLRTDLRAARKELQVSQQRLADAEKRMPKGPPDNEFSKELNDVAKAAGIRVESMPPVGKPQSDGTYQAVQVSVEGTGNWASCMRFLRGISGMNRISRLDSVVLETGEGMGVGSVDPVCHIQVRFSTFFRE